MLNSTRVTDASTACLALAGLSLLFAADAVLPTIAPAVPPGTSWIAELIAPGVLALAMLNWASRRTLLGGVYGRPVVLANALFYFTTTMTVGRLVSRGVVRGSAAFALLPLIALTVLYALLLFRGPLGNDAQRFRDGV